MDADEYQVTVKSANQKVDDQVTKCYSSWTVKKLKQYISCSHPNKPAVDEQRLIYAGTLLNDKHTLKQIFFRDSLCTDLHTSSKTDFTIHLVCAQKPTNSHQSSSTAAAAAALSTPSPHLSFHQPPAAARRSDSTQSQQPVLQQQQQQQQQQPSVSIHQHQNPNIEEPVSRPMQPQEVMHQYMQSEHYTQQVATFQQLANAFAAEIVTYLQNHSSDCPSAQVPTSSMLLRTNQQTQTGASDTQQPQAEITNNASQNFQQLFAMLAMNNNHLRQNDNEPNRDAGFNVNANIQEPLEELAANNDLAGEAMQNDVIDWVYYSMRALVLLMALYIHASLFKLLVIASILGLVYLYRRSSRPRQQQEAPHAQVPGAQPIIQVIPAQAHPQNGGNQELRRRAAQVANTSSDNINQNAENVQPNGANQQLRAIAFIKMVYIIATSFIASLVPE